MVNGQAIPGLDTKELGLRFNLIALVPTTALVLFLVALVRSGAVGGRPSLQQLLTLPAPESLAFMVFGALLVSLVLHPFQILLVRLFEGYWGDGRVGRALSHIGIERHRRRWARLMRLAGAGVHTQDDRQLLQAAQANLRLYPLTDRRLLPTRLGNILRAAEDRAGQRYGLSTITVWPRLYPYVTGQLAAALASVRNQLDVSIRLCASLALATVISGTVLITDGWWLLVPLATGVFAWAGYRSALRAARSYGEAMHWAFDLHRFEMLQAMHYPLPANLAEERAFNQELSRFLASGRPIGGRQSTHQYEHDQQDAASPTSAEDLLGGILSWLTRRAGRRSVEDDRP